jgi:hypothetical protein
MIETLTSGFPRVRCVIVEKRLIAFGLKIAIFYTNFESEIWVRSDGERKAVAIEKCEASYKI